MYRLPGRVDDTLGIYRSSETVEGKLGVLRLRGGRASKLKIDGELGVQRLTGNAHFN